MPVNVNSISSNIGFSRAFIDRILQDQTLKKDSSILEDLLKVNFAIERESYLIRHEPNLPPQEELELILEKVARKELIETAFCLNSDQWLYWYKNNKIRFLKIQTQDPIGKGLSGVIYKVQDLVSNEIFVYKKIRDQNQADNVLKEADFLGRFAREGNPQIGVQLPMCATVASIKSAVFTGLLGAYYDLGNLSNYLKTHVICNVDLNEQSKIEHIIEIFSEISKGLSQIHANGVIHKDLKEANVLVRTHFSKNIDGTTVSTQFHYDISDFGSAWSEGKIEQARKYCLKKKRESQEAKSKITLCSASKALLCTDDIGLIQELNLSEKKPEERHQKIETFFKEKKVSILRLLKHQYTVKYIFENDFEWMYNHLEDSNQIKQAYLARDVYALARSLLFTLNKVPSFNDYLNKSFGLVINQALHPDLKMRQTSQEFFEASYLNSLFCFYNFSDPDSVRLFFEFSKYVFLELESIEISGGLLEFNPSAKAQACAAAVFEDRFNVFKMPTFKKDGLAGFKLIFSNNSLSAEQKLDELHKISTLDVEKSSWVISYLNSPDISWDLFVEFLRRNDVMRFFKKYFNVYCLNDRANQIFPKFYRDSVIPPSYDYLVNILMWNCSEEYSYLGTIKGCGLLEDDPSDRYFKDFLKNIFVELKSLQSTGEFVDGYTNPLSKVIIYGVAQGLLVYNPIGNSNPPKFASFDPNGLSKITEILFDQAKNMDQKFEEIMDIATFSTAKARNILRSCILEVKNREQTGNLLIENKEHFSGLIQNLIKQYDVSIFSEVLAYLFKSNPKYASFLNQDHPMAHFLNVFSTINVNLPPHFERSDIDLESSFA